MLLAHCSGSLQFGGLLKQLPLIDCDLIAYAEREMSSTGYRLYTVYAYERVLIFISPGIIIIGVVAGCTSVYAEDA